MTAPFVPQPRAVPDAITNVMPYATNIALSAVGNVATYQFRGNSIFDPDLTSTGHQPLGHDEFAAMYQRYRVHASRVVLYACNTGDPGLPVQLVIHATNNSTLITNFDTVMEQPYMRTLTLEVDSNGGSCKKLTFPWMSTKKIKGTHMTELDDRFQASYGANPSIEWYWNLYAFTYGGTGVFVDCYAVIEYLVESFDREQLLQS